MREGRGCSAAEVSSNTASQPEAVFAFQRGIAAALRIISPIKNSHIIDCI